MYAQVHVVLVSKEASTSHALRLAMPSSFVVTNAQSPALILVLLACGSVTTAVPTVAAAICVGLLAYPAKNRATGVARISSVLDCVMKNVIVHDVMHHVASFSPASIRVLAYVESPVQRCVVVATKQTSRITGPLTGSFNSNVVICLNSDC